MEIKIKQFFLRNKRFLPIYTFLFLLTVFLQGCASSDVARGASSGFNSTYQGAANAFDSNGVSVTEAYQGTSSTTKGVMLGGATGAIIGGVVSGGSGILPGAAGGAIFGGALGAYIDAHTTLADQIINRGNKVIILGDQVLIVVPSQYVFVGTTPQLQPYAYKTFDLIAQLISGYPNILVKVTTYTDDVVPDSISRSLTQQQSNAVEKYLWRAGINTRMLYAEGGGSSRLITASGSEANNRVEITLEKLPV
jgi:outer membrane protein OmpA-like peptidoglycan-associated protein